MSAIHLGSFNTSGSRTHVGFQFPTFDGSGANVAPSSAFEAADLRIYRAADGAAFSATQRSSANGVTMTSPFDSLTGLHDVDIDLTDNTDSGFYAAGYRYSVVLSPDETVDGQTITAVPLAYFEIGPPPVNVTQFGGTAGTFSSGRPEVNTSHLAGSTSAATKLSKAAKGTVSGSVTGSSSTTTSVVTTGLDPASSVTDEFKGKILTFLEDTTTVGLRGQSTDITGSTTGGVLTVTALTTVPADGDVFLIG